MSVNLAEYWPSPGVGEQLLVQDATLAWGPETLSVLRRYRKGSGSVTILDDYTTAGWLDAWSYTVPNGMVEISDRFLGKNLVFKSGKEIKWGGIMNVGDILAGSVEVDVAASTGVTAGYANYGYQSVTLDEVISNFTNAGGMVFPEAVRLSVFQSWCKTVACVYPSGQNVYRMTYWLAKGMGIVQTDYLEAPAPFTPRLDYAQHIVKTVYMPDVS